MASISDILLAQGQDAANARLRKGPSPWVPLVQALAQVPGDIYASRQAERLAQQQQRQAAMLEDERRAKVADESEIRQQTLAKGKNEQSQWERKSRLAELVSDTSLYGEDGTFDEKRARTVAQERGWQDIGDEISAYDAQHDKDVWARITAQNSATRKPTTKVKVLNPDGSETERIVEDTPGQTFTGAAPKRPMREVVVKGPNGRPVKKLVTEDELLGGIEQYQEPRAPTFEPLEAVIGPDGNPVLLPRSQARGMRPATNREQPTEDERKSAGFVTQMEQAMSIMDEVENSLTQDELYQIQTLPQEGLVGLANRNKLSENAKRYLRAFEQFTEARMRPVSGAAISDSEFARDRRTYAKQYGETPKLAEDRSRARKSALTSLEKRASRALDKDRPSAGGGAAADPLGIR